MKQWIVAPSMSEEFVNLFPEIPRMILQILVNRGVLKVDMDAEEAQKALDEFLNPDYGTDLHDPFLFRDMEKAIRRVADAIEKKEHIVVYGDYDADGVSGAVILMSTLRMFGAKSTIYIPHRETEGYGVNQAAVEQFITDGVSVLITCDCGISNIEEIRRAEEGGINVIITDHHTVPETPPPAYAIIHPSVPGETYPFKRLAGGGVAFKFVQGLLRRQELFHDRPKALHAEAFEKWLLDLVVLSTVADMVPLIGENRTLVKYGLIVLNKTHHIGLRALIDGMRTKQKECDTKTVGWMIAPRINAAGRMDHANAAYELLMTEDVTEAEALAAQLEQANRDRQRLVERVKKEASAQIGENPERLLLGAFGEEWPLGILGLVAGNLSNHYDRPVIVMGLNQGSIVGSGRSVSGFNMIEAMQRHAEFFEKVGGHPMACGFTLVAREVLDAFLQVMEEEARRAFSGNRPLSELSIDGVLTFPEITWELWEHLHKLEPFGEGNAMPQYVAHGVTIETLRCVGNNRKHVQMECSQQGVRRKSIGFSMSAQCENFHVGDSVDIVFSLSVNEWNGNRELQLQLVDVQKSGNT